MRIYSIFQPIAKIVAGNLMPTLVALLELERTNEISLETESVHGLSKILRRRAFS